MVRSSPKQTSGDAVQPGGFAETARALGCADDEAAFDDHLRRVSAKPDEGSPEEPPENPPKTKRR